MQTFTIAAANICGNPPMPDADVDADMATLARIGADVTVACEITLPHYRAAFRQAFTGQTITNLAGSESPTATTLPVRRSWVRTLHSGVAKVTPPRRNAGTRLELSLPVLVIAKHPVSGANRKGAAARRTFRMAVRRRLFALDTALTQRKVRRANAHGVTVVIAGDLNSITAPPYAPGQLVAAHAGLMWVIVSPAPAHRVLCHDPRAIGVSQLHTDHPMIAVDLTMGVRR